MRYFKRRRSSTSAGLDDDDPMTGVANLFDIGLVFIVGLIIILFTAYNLQGLFSEKTEMTIMKISKNKELEIITKKGKKIKALKVSKEKAQGRGERLGIAYRLEDGTMVYVPE